MSLLKSGMDPFEESSTLGGNQTVVIEQREIPVNLRTLVYMDIKRWIYLAGRFLLAGTLIVLVYIYFGMWGFMSFAVMFVLFYQWLIPQIATRFMTYVNLVSLELSETKPDAIKLVQIPVTRFESALILDDEFKKSAPAAPFVSSLGLCYLVDSIDLDVVPNPQRPDLRLDVIVIHRDHKNIDFAKDYVPEFLRMRKEYLKAKRELFSLKATMPITAEAMAHEKVITILEIIDSVLFTADAPVKPSDVEKILGNIEEKLEFIGMDLGTTHHKELLRGMVVKKVKEQQDQDSVGAVA